MYILFIWLASIITQTDGQKISYPHDFFEVDHFGNIYFVEHTELSKFDSKLKKTCSYSDPSLGKISSIDTSNPLRILVFYHDFNQSIYLNNKLAPIGNPINLYDYSPNETELICTSQKGGFWIYNSIDNQATHISSSGTIQTQSSLLNSFFDEAPITKILEYNDDLYLLFSTKGILQLNSNGQFKNQYQIPNITDFLVYQDQIIFQNQLGIYRFQPKKEQNPLLYQNTSQNRIQFQIAKHQLYISNEKSISIINLSF